MVIEKEILVSGDGPGVTTGQIVTVHCIGYVKINDLYKQFWSTRDCKRLRFPAPFSFKVGQGHVIKGWDKGVLGMKLGEVAHLKCTADDAFGAGEYPEWEIGPNSDLEFKIEVIAIDWKWIEEDEEDEGNNTKLPH